ncbi:Amino acid/polyamine transporter I [Penicillium mononematosum]|uniref:Amino acid/polyamine transporter I n=1 Tax=Penicillium mononematosum TaxID=268346 RepID=UPI0025482B6D|nr:Amino acid/polyamine transporter I [Penicillium mononematosum]KAJ6184512.1 Amino acid/polyamine transporter I [Penicillium mononematosum]
MDAPVKALRKQTKRLRQTKQKSVTFTGSRKVKCDERQQNGCGVCQKSGLECAGYGVNLCWMSDKKGELQGLRRRQMRLGESEPSSKGTFVDAILNQNNPPLLAFRMTSSTELYPLLTRFQRRRAPSV